MKSSSRPSAAVDLFVRSVWVRPRTIRVAPRGVAAIRPAKTVGPRLFGAGPTERPVPAQALGAGAAAPCNAQATLWFRAAFAALFLPTTVHGRVSDIWRSYIAQTALRCNGLALGFSGPLVGRRAGNPSRRRGEEQNPFKTPRGAGAFLNVVRPRNIHASPRGGTATRARRRHRDKKRGSGMTPQRLVAAQVEQDRNAHDLLADYMSERPLYERAGALLEVLAAAPCASTLPGAVERLFVRLYEYEFVEASDVERVQAFLRDLARATGHGRGKSRAGWHG